MRNEADLLFGCFSQNIQLISQPFQFAIAKMSGHFYTVFYVCQIVTVRCQTKCFLLP